MMIMTEPQDHQIPASLLLSRLEKHHEEMQHSLDATPKWRFLRRQRLMGAIGAYAYEIEQLLNITAKNQAFWTSTTSNAQFPRINDKDKKA